MSLTFACVSCAQKFVVPRQLAGRRVRCRTCGHEQRIGDPARSLQRPSTYALAPEPPTPRRASTEPASPPTRTRSSRRDPRPVVLGLGIFEESQLGGIACALLALSAADIFMTFTLLRASSAFFESNPVAQWFYARWNMAGMVLFKFSVIGMVIAISEFVERRRPGWGRFVLVIGCLGAAYAVYKGYTLYTGHAAGPSPVE